MRAFILRLGAIGFLFALLPGCTSRTPETPSGLYAIAGDQLHTDLETLYKKVFAAVQKDGANGLQQMIMRSSFDMSLKLHSGFSLSLELNDDGAFSLKQREKEQQLLLGKTEEEGTMPVPADSLFFDGRWERSSDSTLTLVFGAPQSPRGEEKSMAPWIFKPDADSATVVLDGDRLRIRHRVLDPQGMLKLGLEENDAYLDVFLQKQSL